jgi:hypothetical protein
LDGGILPLSFLSVEDMELSGYALQFAKVMPPSRPQGLHTSLRM